MSERGGQRLDRAVVEQDPWESGEPAAVLPGSDHLTKEYGRSLRQKLFHLRVQAFMQGLFGVRGLGREADDGGGPFQGKGGFGGQRGQRQQELGDGDLAGQPLEKATLASQALAIQGGQSRTQMTEVLFDELEKRAGG